MDWVALGPSVVGVFGLVLALYQTKRSADQIREDRHQGRLAEAYIEVPKLVEREGQWVEAVIGEFLDEDGEKYAYEKKPGFPERVLADRAIATAYVEAFGSDDVRRSYEDWQAKVGMVESQRSWLIFNYFENHAPHPLPRSEFAPLVNTYGPRELEARRRLGDVVRRELGHDKPRRIRGAKATPIERASGQP